ncbi:unnamed protein product [Lathyrus oleraceus]
MSQSSLPIVAIVVLTILAIVFIFISYLILVTKCYSNWWHPLRWISILPPSQSEEPFIAFSPRTWNRGVDESVIQEIPTFQFTKGEGGDDRPSVKGCVVCLNSFQEQDMLKVLPNCSHHFHLDCINIWLQTNANCPLCRTSISGNTQFPTNRIIAAPSSSPQDSQLFSNMGSDEDFVVIELWGEGEHRGTMSHHHMQQERNESRESMASSLSRTHSRTRNMEEEEKVVELKPWKCHRVPIMGDECIDVRKKDEQFSIQPIRRSFSLDSASDRKAYLEVQDIIRQNNRHHQNEDCDSEDCNSSKGRRSFFPFRYGRGSKTSLLH